eukprot:gene36405-59506_t
MLAVYDAGVWAHAGGAWYDWKGFSISSRRIGRDLGYPKSLDASRRKVKRPESGGGARAPGSAISLLAALVGCDGTRTGEDRRTRLQEDDGMKVPDSRPAAAYVFPVGERAFCCWEHDHADRTLAFLKGVDREYFATVAGILAAQLSTEQALAASVALRALYQQGIESLMSLLGAMSQAPGC